MGQVFSSFIKQDSHKKPLRRKVKICKEKMVVVKERCVKQYCSSHKILLVVMAFSFSASLAMAFGSASNMIATSLGQVFSNCMKLWFGLVNRKPKLISPPKLDSCNDSDSHSEPCTELSTDCVLHIDSSIQILNEEFKPFFDLNSGEEESRKPNSHKYKSCLDFDKVESQEGRLLCEDERKPNEQNVLISISPPALDSCNESQTTSFTESNAHFVTNNIYSNVQVPVLKTSETKGLIFGEDESKPNEQILLIPPLTLGSCDDSHKRPYTESSSQVEGPEAIKEVRVCKEVVVVKEKWIKQYCSSHKILLVGEGDFSFSASLARVFGSASNMVATSLDSKGFLRKNYKRAMSNIQELKNRGCLVMHGVDATEMADYYSHLLASSRMNQGDLSLNGTGN